MISHKTLTIFSTKIICLWSKLCCFPPSSSFPRNQVSISQKYNQQSHNSHHEWIELLSSLFLLSTGMSVGLVMSGSPIPAQVETATFLNPTYCSKNSLLCFSFFSFFLLAGTQTVLSSVNNCHFTMLANWNVRSDSFNTQKQSKVNLMILQNKLTLLHSNYVSKTTNFVPQHLHASHCTTFRSFHNIIVHRFTSFCISTSSNTVKSD